MAVVWTVSTLKDYSVRIHTLILSTWLPYYRIVTIKTLHHYQSPSHNFSFTNLYETTLWDFVQTLIRYEWYLWPLHNNLSSFTHLNLNQFAEKMSLKLHSVHTTFSNHFLTSILNTVTWLNQVHWLDCVWNRISRKKANKTIERTQVFYRKTI